MCPDVIRNHSEPRKGRRCLAAALPGAPLRISGRVFVEGSMVAGGVRARRVSSAQVAGVVKRVEVLAQDR